MSDVREDANQSRPKPPGVPLSSVCGDLLRRAQQVHNAIWLEEVGDEPTGPQYTVLKVLDAWPDIDQRQLSRLASLDKSSTADIVARLVNRGELEKRRAPDDGRRDMVALSDTATILLSKLAPHVARVQARFLEPLAPWQRTTIVQQLAAVGRVESNVNPAASVSHFGAPGHLTRRALQVHTALFTEEFGRRLTTTQYATLQVLSVHSMLSQRELGEYAALSTSTAADIVRRLVRRGWIARHRDPRDGRRLVLALTGTGERAMRIDSRILALQEELLKPLRDEERTELRSSLSIISYPTLRV